jgi:hypothetical protein
MELTVTQQVQKALQDSVREFQRAGDLCDDMVRALAKKTQGIFDHQISEQNWHVWFNILPPLAGLGIVARYGYKAPLVGRIRAKDIQSGLGQIPELFNRPYFGSTEARLTQMQEQAKTSKDQAGKQGQTLDQLCQDLLRAAAGFQQHNR